MTRPRSATRETHATDARHTQVTSASSVVTARTAPAAASRWRGAAIDPTEVKRSAQRGCHHDKNGEGLWVCEGNREMSDSDGGDGTEQEPTTANENGADDALVATARDRHPRGTACTSLGLSTGAQPWDVRCWRAQGDSMTQTCCLACG